MNGETKTAENIVPSLASCLMIPSGAFADSALVWERNIGLDGTEYDPFVNTRKNALCQNILFPAPTLEEVIACFPNHMFYICRSFGKWNVEAIDRLRMMPTAIGKSTVSSSDAALNVWLTMKGIKA